jgi:hypothetical protein
MSHMGNKKNLAVLGRSYMPNSSATSGSDSETPSRPALVSAAPIVELIDQLQQEHDALSRRAPDSELAACIGSVVKDLALALERAGEVDVFLTVEEVWELTGKPTSTVRRICLTHGQAAGATKVQGSWMIHWPTFEQFLRCHPNQEAA